MNMANNFGTIIDRESWEAHIVDPFSQMLEKSRAGQNSPNRNKSTESGLLIRDKIINQSVFLLAFAALEILKDMQEVETWKTNGMVIGAPALTSAPKDEKTVEEEILHTPFVRQYPKYVLSDPLRLTPEQSKEFFEFLLQNEELLRGLAEKDEIVARRQLTDMFKKIAEFGRKKRLGKDK